MAQFQKKPVVIEAVRYAGGNDRDGYSFEEMKPDWLNAAFGVQPGHPGSVWRKVDGTLRVQTLEGEMIASAGIFAATYRLLGRQSGAWHAYRDAPLEAVNASAA
jgi:hypothetical protein